MQPTKKAIQQIEELLEKKHNIILGQPLGKGAMGIAFTVENHPEFVIKITTDETEAQAAQKACDNVLPGIARYYSAWKLPASGNTVVKGGWTVIPEDTYVLLMEKLDELSTEESNFASFFQLVVSGDLGMYTAPENSFFCDINKAKAMIFVNADSTATDYAEQLADDIRSGRFQKMFKQMLEGLCNIGKLGIEFIDYHENNLMKDKSGNYKWIDLGVSKTHTQEKIDLLEFFKYSLPVKD